MKKLVLLIMLMTAAISAQADGYTYLTFETTDGAKVSVEVSALSITISGTTLTAGSQQFTLSNLNKMYFSNSDETTGIESITISTLDDDAEIYDLNGRKVAKDQLKKGVYVVKSNSGNHKIVVK